MSEQHLTTLSEYYKRFWRQFRLQVRKAWWEAVIAIVAIIAALFLQFYFGWIKKEQTLPSVLLNISPYVAILIAYVTLHLIRTPWLLDDEKQKQTAVLEGEIERLKSEQKSAIRELKDDGKRRAERLIHERNEKVAALNDTISSLESQLNRKPDIKGEIKCVHTKFATSEEQGEEGTVYFDCYITLNAVIWNEGKATTIKGFKLKIISRGREFENAGAPDAVGNYLLLRQMSRAEAGRLQRETVYKNLNDLEAENHLPLGSGHREGWLRFIVRLPLSEVKVNKLQEGAQAILIVSDIKNTAHAIVCSSIEPCGRIEKSLYPRASS